nr:GNAT family N-acetyltransferase [Candidatus Sigynarchaeota archaeon]
MVDEEYTIRPIQLPTELDVLVATWNAALPASFTMSPERLNGYLSLDPNFDPEGCLGAFSGTGDLHGFVIGKRWLIPNHDMADDDATQWRRDGTMGVGMIGVKPDFQRKGIGKKLMKAIEAFFRKHEAGMVSIGREPGRHFLPGVPGSIEDTLEFFDKCGYNRGFEMAIDIIGDISAYEEFPRDNPKLCEKIKNNKADGFDVVGFRPALKGKVLAFMNEQFKGRWYWRVAAYANEPRAAPDELQLLVRKKGKAVDIVGFAATASQASFALGSPTIVQSRGDTQFGGLGPIGIARELRGSRGLGAMLLHYALLNLKRKGVKRVLIDWTSQDLLKRYYGPAGFKQYENYVSVKTEFE